MNRRQNPTNNPKHKRGKRGQFAEAAPQEHSSTPVEMQQLQNALDSANHKNHLLEQSDADWRGMCDQWQSERYKLCLRIHNGKYHKERLQGLLELRVKEFQEEHKRNYETIKSLESENESLKKSLDQKNLPLTELQNKVDQLDQQLHQRDETILALTREKDGFFQMLTDATNRLKSNRDELLQTDQAWQAKYQALQKKFTELTKTEGSCDTARNLEEEMKEKINQLEKENKDLLEGEQSWKAQVQQLEKEKTELVQLCSDLKKKRKGFLCQKKRITTRQRKAGRKTGEKYQLILKKEKKERDSLTEKLSEVTTQLKNTVSELQRSDEAWQQKCDALQEKFREELARKEETWERRVRQLEEENRGLLQKEKSWEERIRLMEEHMKELSEKDRRREEREEQLEKEKKDSPPPSITPPSVSPLLQTVAEKEEGEDLHLKSKDKKKKSLGRFFKMGKMKKKEQDKEDKNTQEVKEEIRDENKIEEEVKNEEDKKDRKEKKKRSSYWRWI